LDIVQLMVFERWKGRRAFAQNHGAVSIFLNSSGTHLAKDMFLEQDRPGAGSMAGKSLIRTQPVERIEILLLFFCNLQSRN